MFVPRSIEGPMSFFEVACYARLVWVLKPVAAPRPDDSVYHIDVLGRGGDPGAAVGRREN